MDYLKLHNAVFHFDPQWWVFFIFICLFIHLYNIISCHTDLVYNLILTAEPVILAQTWHKHGRVSTENTN